MESQEGPLQIRQAGMEKAAVIWETLENLPQPIEPADIYKAVTTVKCAEFASRIRAHRYAEGLLKLVLQFLDDTLGIVGVDVGTIAEGARVLAVLAEVMPLTDDIFNDPEAYATRQHVYDGLLLLSAVKLGKEAETEKSIEDMQHGVAKLWITNYFKERGLDFDPDKTQA